MEINIVLFKRMITFVMLVSLHFSALAQQRLGDNLGNHKILGNLDLNTKSIDNAKVITTQNVVIGTAGKVNNTSIALQVNGSNQTILIPRVTDLLNATAPGIPIADVVEGMIVYDLMTRKFYVKEDTAWKTYMPASLASGQLLVGNANGVANNVSVTGDVTFTNTGVTAIGNLKVQNDMLADQSVTTAKIAPGTVGQFLQTNATATAMRWVTVVPANYVDIVNRRANINGFKMFTSDSGFVATGTLNAGGTPVTTPGPRMIWHPRRAAFKAGTLEAGGLTDANIGLYSAAFGNSTASGSNSIAAGLSTASGAYSAAFGESKATADYAVAGGKSTASGQYATAFGESEASGTNAVAMGRAKASGISAVALGNNALASGDYSVAIGNSSNTAGYSGSFAFADGLGTAVSSTANNQFTSRFSGGYQFLTNSAGTSGVSINPGGNSWNIVSDKRKKENFEPVDAALFLKKIDTMMLSSWNYKGQDPKSFRHYGPMAQDFYAAFGRDSYGTIGNDTTIASADIDGVNFIAVQGLVRKTNLLNKEIEALDLQQNVLLKQLDDEQIQFDLAMQQLKKEADDDNKTMQLKIAAIREEWNLYQEKVALRSRTVELERMNAQNNIVTWYEKVQKLIWKTAERVKNR